jgi:hypothetical protein
MIGRERTACKPADHGKPPVTMNHPDHNPAQQTPVPGTARAGARLRPIVRGGRAARGRRR